MSKLLFQGDPERDLDTYKFKDENVQAAREKWVCPICFTYNDISITVCCHKN